MTCVIRLLNFTFLLSIILKFPEFRNNCWWAKFLNLSLYWLVNFDVTDRSGGCYLWNRDRQSYPWVWVSWGGVILSSFTEVFYSLLVMEPWYCFCVYDMILWRFFAAYCYYLIVFWDSIFSVSSLRWIA